MHHRTAPPHRTIVPHLIFLSIYRYHSGGAITASAYSAGLRRGWRKNHRRSLDFILQRSEIMYSVEVETKKKPLPKSKWMKEVVPDSEKYVRIKKKLREL
ncbi:hypothetical protein ACSQ67_020407 [Phaseolus vulgaris]